MTRWRNITAVAAAVAIFAVLIFVFRMRGWIPFAVSGFAWAAIMLAMTPRTRTRAQKLPHDVDGEEFETAMAAFGGAAAELRRLAPRAPRADEPLFGRMAELMETIRDHIRASPAHVALTRTFRRHTLARMVGAVSDYVDLAERAGGNGRDRLEAISDQLEGFIPILERIDQACIDNDLLALEVNVEVLNEQFDRKR